MAKNDKKQSRSQFVTIEPSNNFYLDHYRDEIAEWRSQVVTSKLNQIIAAI